MFLQVFFCTKNASKKNCFSGSSHHTGHTAKSSFIFLTAGAGCASSSSFFVKIFYWLLNSHGFCSSYSRIQHFEQSASVCQGTNIPSLTPSHFVQFAADNVDHNILTIDDKNTFHGMELLLLLHQEQRTSAKFLESRYQQKTYVLLDMFQWNTFNSDTAAMRS